jgi:hypothetical protein
MPFRRRLAATQKTIDQLNKQREALDAELAGERRRKPSRELT